MKFYISRVTANKKESYARIYAFSMILIIFVAVFLRLYNLTERGLLYYDEGYYTNQAKFIVLSSKWTLKNVKEVFANGVNLDDLWSFVNENGGTFPHTRKPGHDLLNTVSFLILGVQDWSLFVMSALFGVGTIIVVFTICKNFINIQSGLIASSILAVSNIHIWFSRSAMAQASSVFFIILGTYLYLKSFQGNNRCTKKLLLAGLCIGFAFTIHPNLFLVPIIFFISEVFFLIKKEVNIKLVQKIFKSIYLALFMLIPLLIFQMPYFILKSFYGENLASMNSQGVFLTYFDQVFGASSKISGRISDRFAFDFKSLAVLHRYLKDLLASEGIVVLIFFILGLVYLFLIFFKNKDHKALLFLLLFFLPLLFWGISGVSYRLRLICIILPTLSIFAGIGAKFLFDRIQNKFTGINQLSNVLVLTLIFSVLAVGSYNTKEIINLKVKPIYRELEQFLINYIDENGGILTDKQGHFYPIMRFYLGNLIEKIPARFQKNIILSSEVTKKKKIPYYGDYIIMLGDEWKDPPRGDFMKEKIKGCMPIISLEYPIITFVKSDKPPFEKQKYQFLRVFDLRRCKPLTIISINQKH